MPTVADPAYAGLVRAILENPFDDVPRLILADWLDENGDPDRAEFIRLQMRIAEMRPGPEEHRKASNLLRRFDRGAPVPMRAKTPAAMMMRETILLRDNAMRWQEYWFDGVRFGEPSRGFVETASCNTAAWLTHGSDAVVSYPLVGVTLADKEPWLNPQVGSWLWLIDLSAIGMGQDDLPPELFNMLQPDRDRVSAKYSTRNDALEALSRACVDWARREAGLPELSWPA